MAWQILLTVHIGSDMGDLQFLQQKADIGNLIIVNGTIATTGVAVSYTVPNGKTFVLYKAALTMDVSSNTDQLVGQLRNNGTVKDAIRGTSTGQSLGASVVAYTSMPNRSEFIIMGDILAGDGVKTYDVNVATNGSSASINATIEGYLE